MHNILEPASFGLPVIFGNKFEKFPEAYQFIENGIGFSVVDKNSFNQVFDQLASQNLKEHVLAFMQSQKGATDKILSTIIDS